MESKLLNMSQGESNSTTVSAPTLSSNKNEDLISDLPDDLLHHIFSFLDMVYAARTSCLSTRWRYVWTSLPYLNFSEEVYLEANEKYSRRYLHTHPFENFVDNVLILRKNTNIKTLQLSLGNLLDSCSPKFSIKRWINAAVWRNVEAVDLAVGRSEFGCHSILEAIGLIISQMFTCKTLTKLKLQPGRLERLELPNSIAQPAIRSLHLIDSGIRREEISSFFSRLPVLETLIFSTSIATPTICGYLHISDIDINITYNKLLEEYGEKMLSSQRDHCKMEAYKIEGLATQTHLYDHIFYLPRPTLQKVITDMVDAIENFQGTANVASFTLSISSKLLKFLFDVAVSVEDLHITSYFGLRFMKLDTEIIVLSMLYLLEKCPNVETCVLDLTKHPLNDPLREEVHDRIWNRTLKNHIKFLEIKGVGGYDYELEFLKFLEILLTNAPVIEKITIFISRKQKQSKNSRLRLRKFRMKLSTSIKSWSNVEVMFF